MRRSIGLVVGIATLALAATPVAADTNTELNFPNFRPDSSSALAHLGCTLPGVIPNITINTTIAWKSFTQILGDRSWAWNLDNLGSGVGFVKDVADVAGGSLLSVDVYPAESPVTGVAYVSFTDPVATTTNWLGRAQLSESGATWRTIDATTLTYTWSRYSSSGTELETGATGTVATFLPLHGVHRPGSAAIAFGCNGSSFALDRLRFGPTGNVATYDLEGVATQTSIDRSTGTITAGDTITLTSATTFVTGGAVSVPALVLQAKPAGAATFTNVKTVNAVNGVVSTTVKPTVNTTYRWYSEGTETADSSTSSTRVIRVRSKVTATAADRTIKAGSTVVVTGKTTPARAGATVVLARSTLAGDSQLATTRVAANGSFRFSVPLRQAGTWKLLVVAPKSKLNLVGRSPVVTITVTKAR